MTGDRGQIEITDRKVHTIVAGSEHLMVVAGKADGETRLMVGGWNEHGNLGVGDCDNRDHLVEVPLPGRIRRVWGGLAATWVWVEE